MMTKTFQNPSRKRKFEKNFPDLERFFLCLLEESSIHFVGLVQSGIFGKSFSFSSVICLSLKSNFKKEQFYNMLLSSDETYANTTTVVFDFQQHKRRKNTFRLFEKSTWNEGKEKQIRFP